MKKTHKNKTLTTLLAFLFGVFGAHRFYMYGLRDKWGWLHLISLPLASVLLTAAPDLPLFFAAGPMILSTLIAFLAALVIGLTPDDKWDARHNPESGRMSNSRWPLAILLVLTLGVGATSLIAVIARSFDLFLTGGAYG